jgi:hypothetical protein
MVTKEITAVDVTVVLLVLVPLTTLLLTLLIISVCLGQPVTMTLRETGKKIAIELEKGNPDRWTK